MMKDISLRGKEGISQERVVNKVQDLVWDETFAKYLSTSISFFFANPENVTGLNFVRSLRLPEAPGLRGELHGGEHHGDAHDADQQAPGLRQTDLQTPLAPGANTPCPMKLVFLSKVLNDISRTCITSRSGPPRGSWPRGRRWRRSTAITAAWWLSRVKRFVLSFVCPQYFICVIMRTL